MFIPLLILNLYPFSSEKSQQKLYRLGQPNSLKYGIFGHLEGRILNKGPLDH
jgi:hypothetical protein